MDISSDYLEFIKKNFKKRELNWLWAYLRFSKGIILDEKYQHENTLNYLIDIIKSQINIFEIINEVKNEYDRMISYDYIKWINKNDGRLIIWLYMSYSIGFHHLNRYAAYDTIFIEQYYDNFICRIDRSMVHSPEQKKQLLLGMQRSWRELKTPLSKTKWLDPNNSEQLKWAWEYMTQATKFQIVPQPANDQETYDAILASLDTMSFVNPEWRPADKQVFLDKIRKAWQQKKFRDADKVKNPYHLPLTKQAKKQLDWLAQFNNIKPNTMLETLITKEYERARLDKNGKALY